MKRLVVLLLAVIALFSWWWLYGQNNHRAQYSGTIEAEDASLGSKIGGRVVSVAVQEGDRVKAGDVLLQLDKEALEAQLAEAEAQLEQAKSRLLEMENGSRRQEVEQAEALLDEARAQLALYENGARKEDIAAAQANAEAARAEVELAQLTEKRQKDLLAAKNTSVENHDRAKKELLVAQNRLRSAEAELERLRAGFRREEIASARARVAAASAALDLLREGARTEHIEQARLDVKRLEAAIERIRVDLNEKEITAPVDGVIEVSRLQPGDLLSPNQTALSMILFEPVWVRVYVPESRLGAFPVGSPVEITTASFPDQRFSGRVAQLNRRAEFTPRNVQTPETRDDLVFGVKIEIDDPQHQLLPGMVADIHPQDGDEQ